MSANITANDAKMNVVEANPSQQVTVDFSAVGANAPQNLKRSHRDAFLNFKIEYGGVRLMQLAELPPIQTPESAVAQASQRQRCPSGSSLKSCLRRRESDREGGHQPQSAGKAVRFNETVQTWGFTDYAAGGYKWVQNTIISEVHSAEWQAYLVKRAARGRERLRRILKAGGPRSCVSFLKQQNDAPDSEHNWGRNGVGNHYLDPFLRCAVKALACSDACNGSEVQVLHITNEQMKRQTFGIINDIVKDALETQVPDWERRFPGFGWSDAVRNDMDDRLERLGKICRRKLEKKLPSKGMSHPDRRPGRSQPEEAIDCDVWDAQEDNDWNEVDVKAEAVGRSCPTAAVMRRIQDDLDMFKMLVDLKIREEAPWSRSTVK